nr:MAG TPA: hypothetical protein [Caudoviricetes sp.]
MWALNKLYLFFLSTNRISQFNASAILSIFNLLLYQY